MSPGDHARNPSSDHRNTSDGDDDLTRLVPLATLQSMQDRFARLGQFSICICDARGERLTEPTWGSRYSELIGTSPRGRDEWHDALREIAQSGEPTKPVIVLEGMTLYASPVPHEGRNLAVIAVGTRPLDTPNPEVVRQIASRYGADPDQLVQSIKPDFAWTGGTPESIHQFADLLADTLATLYDQADRIDRQLADLRTVHSLSELLSRSHRVQQVLDITVTRVAELMNAKASAIRLLNEETGELLIRARHNLSEDYLRKGPVMVDGNAIDAAAFRGETVYIEDARTDPRIRYPENARREGIVSGLCVPMTFRGETVGVLRVYAGEHRTFSELEQQLLRSIAAQAASAVIANRLRESVTKDERDRRQFEAARLIQRRMLPSGPPAHSTLDFGCVYEPCLQLGGDFFDFVECSDGSLGACIADVAGKGLPAALLMASVRSSMRAHAAPAETVADLIARTNRDMCRDTAVGEFATMFFGLFTRDAKRLSFCNAGHVPPLMLRDQNVIQLDVGGGVIGVSADEDYQADTVNLRPGDVIAMMTDGVTEAFDFQERPYGVDRTIRSLRRHRDLPAQSLATELLWDVRRFVGLAERSDDITIVVVKVRDP